MDFLSRLFNLSPGSEQEIKQTFGDVGPWPGRFQDQAFDYREVGPRGAELLGTGEAFATGLIGSAGLTWNQSKSAIMKSMGKQIAETYKDKPNYLAEVLPKMKNTILGTNKTLNAIEQNIGVDALDKLFSNVGEIRAGISSPRSRAGEGGISGSYDPTKTKGLINYGIPRSSAAINNPETADLILHEALHSVQHKGLREPELYPSFVRDSVAHIVPGFSEKMVESGTRKLLGAVYPNSSILTNENIVKESSSPLMQRYLTTPESRLSANKHLQEIFGVELYNKIFGGK